MNHVKDRICLALDVGSTNEAKQFVEATSKYVGFYKIGLQLFCAEGPRIIDAVMKIGGKVFLDLKFHDIPNTVAGATRSIVELGVDIFNIHASGGKAMMTAAVSTASEESKRLRKTKPLVIGVTLLTSLSTETLQTELSITEDSKSYAIRLAKLSKVAGLDGVVCSAQETQSIRRELGPKFFIINPGIRPEWAATGDDQRRITTPAQAVVAGADLIVIGRPILKSDSPAKAAELVLKELKNALSS